MKALFLEKFLKGEIGTNGYCYFDEFAFDNKPYTVCYIPDGAEDEDHVFTRKDLEAEVRDFIRSNREFVETDMEEDETMAEYERGVLLHMWSCLEWQFPCSALEDYLQARLIHNEL
jgi:hypothetical protein